MFNTYFIRLYPYYLEILSKKKRVSDIAWTKMKHSYLLLPYVMQNTIYTYLPHIYAL